MVDLPPPSRITTVDTWLNESVITQSLDIPSGKIRVFTTSNATNMPTAEDEQTFYALADQWRSETRHMSLAADKAANFALHQIIGMGEKALPLILTELQAKTTDWFWALRAIARDRAPAIPQDAQGIVRQIADIWIQWGKDNGYLRS